MITERDKQAFEQKSLDDQKQECEDIIRAAACYERLESNPDFKQVVEHMNGLIKIHQTQIAGWTAQLEGASFFKRVRIMDVVLVHQIRMAQIQEAVNYPKIIIHEAQEARDLLHTMRTKETVHA